MSTGKALLAGAVIGAALARPKEALMIAGAVLVAMDSPEVKAALLDLPQLKPYWEENPEQRDQYRREIAAALRKRSEKRP